jgi:hypothetical protein
MTCRPHKVALLRRRGKARNGRLVEWLPSTLAP